MTYRDFNEWVDTHLEVKDPNDFVRTDFSQNFYAAAGLMIDEELSTSQYIADSPKREQNAWVDELIEAGDFPNANAFFDPITGQQDYNASRIYLQQRGWDQFESDAELDDRVRWDLKESRKRAGEIHKKAGFWGTTGMVAGMGAGIMADPVLWPSLLVGPAATARVVGTVAKMARGAAKLGAIGAVEETLIQPLVYDWKSELGLDYTVGQAMTNIAIVTGASGMIGAFAEGLKAWVKSSKRAGMLDETDEAVLDHMVKQAEEMAEHPNAKNMTAKEAFENAEKVSREVQGAGPLDMDTRPLGEFAEEDSLLDQAFKDVVDNDPQLLIPVTGRGVGKEGSEVMESVNPTEYIAKVDDFAKRAREALACMGRPASG